MLTPHGDSDLLDRARRGDTAATAALYATHLDSGRRLAALLAGPEAADDLMAESFARVLAQFRAGRGPTSNFRSYLFAVIRNRYRDLLREQVREEPISHQPWLFEHALGHVVTDDVDQGLDDVLAALNRLPDSWRRVLWLLEVERRPLAEVADLLGLTPAAVSSLCYRAREGLRTAYLDIRVAQPGLGSTCDWTRQRLGRYARGTLSGVAGSRVHAHLDECASCADVLADLEQVNRRIVGAALDERVEPERRSA